MSATATIEGINGEQIATRTDLLLMRARVARVRLSSNKLAFANDAHVARARASQRTMFIRVPRAATSTTTAAILACVFAIAIAITSLL
jgi:glutamine amidotransferase PdxT